MKKNKKQTDKKTNAYQIGIQLSPPTLCLIKLNNSQLQVEKWIPIYPDKNPSIPPEVDQQQVEKLLKLYKNEIQLGYEELQKDRRRFKIWQQLEQGADNNMSESDNTEQLQTDETANQTTQQVFEEQAQDKNYIKQEQEKESSEQQQAEKNQQSQDFQDYQSQEITEKQESVFEQRSIGEEQVQIFANRMTISEDKEKEKIKDFKRRLSLIQSVPMSNEPIVEFKMKDGKIIEKIGKRINVQQIKEKLENVMKRQNTFEDKPKPLQHINRVKAPKSRSPCRRQTLF